MCNLILEEDQLTVFALHTPNQLFFEDGKKINITDFENACESVARILERLGTVFTPIVYDMKNCTATIRRIVLELYSNYEYLEDVILKEKIQDKTDLADSIVWLKRYMNFILNFFERIYARSKINAVPYNLDTFLNASYADILGNYHGWVGGQFFKILCKSAPNKKDLFRALALQKNIKESYILKDMKTFVEALKSFVGRLQAFLQTYNLETAYRI